MLGTIRLPKNLGNLNRGMLPQKNYLEMSNVGSGSDYNSVPVDRDEVRKSLNRRRAGKVVKSLDPYRNHDNTDNPKVSKKLELQDTKASQDFNNREEEQIDSGFVRGSIKSARDSIQVRKRKIE